MGKFALAIIASLVPIVLWGAYFRYKNPRKQSVLEAMKIFLFGMISIVPVIIFHQWFLGTVIKGLTQGSSFLSIPFVHATLELLLAIVFVVFFMFLFALIQSIEIKLLYKMPWKESFRKIYKRGYSLTPIILIFALFLVIDAVTNLSAQQSFLLSAAGSTIIFAVLEEYFKFIINPFLVYKKLNSIGTAMVDALYVGLAFAYVENVLFFFINFRSEQFWNIVIFRSLVTTLLHVGASGLLGYFYGLARFSKSVLTNYEIEKSSYKKHLWFRGWLNKETMYKSLSVTRGFFLAAFVHAIFNLLLTMGQRTIAAIMVGLLTIIVVMLLRSKRAHVQYGLIGSKAMPVEDYERLRLQISVLQHTKEIQKERMKDEQTALKMKQQQEEVTSQLQPPTEPAAPSQVQKAIESKMVIPPDQASKAPFVEKSPQSVGEEIEFFRSSRHSIIRLLSNDLITQNSNMS